MNAATLLDRLDGARQTGPGRWIARCPAHEDRSPSLSVRELDDGRILLHDFAGCAPGEILAAVGLSFSDLFPEQPKNTNREDGGFSRERRPFDPVDVLRILGRECHVCAQAAGDALAGRPVSAADAQRAALAVGRICAALAAIEGE